jgi:hypothetical protein
MGADAQNLTGVWQGLYTYPNSESASFVAPLIDSSGACAMSMRGGLRRESALFGHGPRNSYAAHGGFLSTR